MFRLGARGFGWAVRAAAIVLVVACGGSEFEATSGGAAGASGPSGGGSEDRGASSGLVSTSSVGAGGAAGDFSDADFGGGSGSGGATSADANPSHDAESVETGQGGTLDAGPRDAVASDGTVVSGKCPPTEPNVNLPCADGLDCTYGTHPRPACRREYVCASSHWSLSPAVACPDLGDCLNEPDKAQVGASCSMPEHDCLYSMGLYCRCRPGPDGGGATWDCYPPPQGCPNFPPNKGQACDITFVPCAYGTCPLGTKVSTSCSGGIVRWTIPACPAP